LVLVVAALNGHMAPLRAAKAISAYGPASGPSRATLTAVKPNAVVVEVGSAIFKAPVAA